MRAICTLLLLLGSTLLSSPSGATLSPRCTFQRLVDTETLVPGKTIPFLRFVSPPSYSNGTVVFCGNFGFTSGQWVTGIYRWDAGVLSIVADNTTPIPGAGTTVFGHVDDPVIQNGTIAFLGYDPGSTRKGGIYRVDAGGFHLVASNSTLIPSGTGTFLAPWFFLPPALDAGVVAFGYWYNSVGGLYTDAPGALTRVIDEHTPVPGGTGLFTRFNYLDSRSIAVSSGQVFFVGSDSVGVEAIYRWAAGNLEAVVDAASCAAIGIEPLGFEAIDVDGERLLFVVRDPDGDQALVRLEQGALTIVHRSEDALPGFDTAARYFESLSLDGSTMAFTANSSCGFAFTPIPGCQRLYVEDPNGLELVVANNDTLDGKPVRAIALKPGALSGNQLAVRVQFHDYSEALYLISILPEPTAVGDGLVGASVALAAPYPNPSRQRTTLEFYMSVRGRVAATIFDARGRQVRTLESGELPAGSHELIWDGKDQQGSAVASGSYFYVVDRDGKRIGSRRAVILR